MHVQTPSAPISISSTSRPVGCTVTIVQRCVATSAAEGALSPHNASRSATGSGRMSCKISSNPLRTQFEAIPLPIVPRSMNLIVYSSIATSDLP